MARSGRMRASMDAPSSWRDEVVGLIPALRAFAWSLSHNGSDADDLVQDTLIKAWTNRDKFEPGTNLRAWLFTILRNTYYTNVLRRRREVRDETGEYASTLRAPPTQDWSVAMRSLQTALHQLIDQRDQLVRPGAHLQAAEHSAQRLVDSGFLLPLRGRPARHWFPSTAKPIGYSASARDKPEADIGALVFNGQLPEQRIGAAG